MAQFDPNGNETEAQWWLPQAILPLSTGQTRGFLSIYSLIYLVVLGLSHSMLDLSSPLGVNQGPLHWKLKVLATGP